MFRSEHSVPDGSPLAFSTATADGAVIFGCTSAGAGSSVMLEMCCTDVILSGVGGSGGVTQGGVTRAMPGGDDVGLLDAEAPPGRGPEGTQG